MSTCPEMSSPVDAPQIVREASVVMVNCRSGSIKGRPCNRMLLLHHSSDGCWLESTLDLPSDHPLLTIVQLGSLAMDA